jgi:hypothetical protein
LCTPHRSQNLHNDLPCTPHGDQRGARDGPVCEQDGSARGSLSSPAWARPPKRGGRSSAAATTQRPRLAPEGAVVGSRPSGLVGVACWVGMRARRDVRGGSSSRARVRQLGLTRLVAAEARWLGRGSLGLPARPWRNDRTSSAAVRHPGLTSQVALVGARRLVVVKPARLCA